MTVQCFCLISDSLDHSAHFVKYVTTKVMEHLRTRINLNRVIIFSDGCSSQYKSRLPFYYLQNMAADVFVERCYCGPHHGKNLGDALGGTVKSAAKREVKARNATITTSVKQNCELTLDSAVTKGDVFSLCRKRM